HLISGGRTSPLDAPWGLAIAPRGFGPFGGDLLVGNLGNGWINAFNVTTGKFAGTLDDRNGYPVTINGLWGIRPGSSAFGGAGAESSRNAASPAWAARPAWAGSLPATFRYSVPNVATPTTSASWLAVTSTPVASPASATGTRTITEVISGLNAAAMPAPDRACAR